MTCCGAQSFVCLNPVQGVKLEHSGAAFVMANYTNEQSSVTLFMCNNKVSSRGAVSHGIGSVLLMKMREKKQCE